MLTLVIQAGGESRRMGQDKGLVQFLGQPLVQRAVERLSSIADETIVTTNRPEAYRFLGVRLEPDLLPGRGALGGLYTALGVASHRLVAVVACDMPFASRELFQAAREILEKEPFDAVVPRPAHGTEPFHAVYRRESCLRAVQAAMEQGAWRADAWHPNVRMRLLSPEEIQRYDPNELAFLNVNDPQELAQAEERARQLSNQA